MPNYTLGPEDGILSVRTARTGAVAKAGHDLLIHVTAWSATLDLDAPSLALEADSTSLRVREGTGGMQALDDGDLANIETTINDEVLLRRDIVPLDVGERRRGLAARHRRPHAVREHAPDRLRPDADRRRVKGTAVVKQTDLGMKPYTALFGALKVADEVRVEIDAALPQSR